MSIVSETSTTIYDSAGEELYKVDIVPTVNAEAMKSRGDIKSFLEINFGITTGSVFQGTLAMWLDGRPEIDWLTDARNRILSIAIRNRLVSGFSVVGIPDGKHTLYVAVDHPEGDKWNAHIVVDDDTLEGVQTENDIAETDIYTIDFTLRNGSVVRSNDRISKFSATRTQMEKVPGAKTLVDTIQGEVNRVRSEPTLKYLADRKVPVAIIGVFAVAGIGIAVAIGDSQKRRSRY